MPSPEKKSLFTTFTTVMFSACNSVFIEVRMYLRVLNYTNTRGCFHIHMGIDSGFAYSMFYFSIRYFYYFSFSNKCLRSVKWWIQSLCKIHLRLFSSLFLPCWRVYLKVSELPTLLLLLFSSHASPQSAPYFILPIAS